MKQPSQFTAMPPGRKLLFPVAGLLLLLVCLTPGPTLAQHENKPDPDLLERTRSSVASSLNYLSEKIDALFR